MNIQSLSQKKRYVFFSATCILFNFAKLFAKPIADLGILCFGNRVLSLLFYDCANESFPSGYFKQLFSTSATYIEYLIVIITLFHKIYKAL